MRFAAIAGDHTVTFDYPLRPGDPVAGTTPLQMVLASLAVCSGSTLSLVLGRMGQHLRGLRVHARAERRDEHPTVLTSIALDFEVQGDGVSPDAVQRALDIAEHDLCPVWAMLKAGTPITASFVIIA